MEQVERARERLENIRSVKPILNGLRTISLGSWQAALKRRSSARAYAERLEDMLPTLVPHLEIERGVLDRVRERLPIRLPGPGRRVIGSEPGSGPTQAEALVIGSERGLCGRFNVAVVERAERYLRQQTDGDPQVNLRTLGSRAQRILRRRGYEAAQAGTLSITTLPSLAMAFDLTRRWLMAYEEHELDVVHLIYNDYRGTGAYEPTVTRLIPPQLPTRTAFQASEDRSSQRAGSWPPPIVDTDPFSLYTTVVEQWTGVQLYNVLLDSSAAEHSTRFQLMESATQNADQLIEELTLVIQTARRQEITQEMAELAAGAGLLQDE